MRPQLNVIHCTTITYFHKVKYHGRATRLKPHLIVVNIKKRKGFAAAISEHVSTFWQNVIFSDEFTFV